MVGFYPYLAVIISGASVLALDILGARVLAPFYGVSLFLWSALIGVTFAALSLGYVIGGRWADRGAKPGGLYAIIGIAGLWIAVVPWLRGPVCTAVDAMDFRIAVFAAVTILFFPPLVLLGMVCPWAVRMKTLSLATVGRMAGNIYATFTIASVGAVIVTDFLIIPNVGVQRSIFVIGLVLIATALIGFAGRFKSKGMAAAPLILIALGMLAFQAAPAQTAADPQRGLIAVEQTANAEIRVIDLDEARHMFIDGNLQAVAEPAPWDSHLPYLYVLDIVKEFFPQPGEMLVVGLGGGAVVKHFVHNDWRADAIEVNPDVTRIARKYFWFKEDEAQVYEMDCRRFLAVHDKIYDFVVMDFFKNRPFPSSLVTEEALGLFRSRLSPAGILAMNIEAVSWHDKMVTSLAATANRVFKHVLLLPIAEPPNQYGNLVLLASDREFKLRAPLAIPMDRFTPEYDRAHAWDNQFQVDVKGIPVFTDNFNPSEIWSEPANLISRKQLHEVFDSSGVVW